MTDHAAQNPGEPLAIEFANTHYARRGKVREGLASPALLADWLRANSARLAAAGAPGTTANDPNAAEPTEAELAAFVRLRDTIRGLARASIDHEPLDPADVAVLNEAAATAPTWPELRLGADTPGVVERSRDGGTASALGTIARDAVRLLGGAAREEIRACPAPGCVQYFVRDHPRREYCCAACGNRARVARHHQRHRDA